MLARGKKKKAEKKKDETTDIASSENSNDNLRKVGSVVVPAVVGAVAVPFVLSATALSATVVGGIVGAVCGASYLAGKNK